MEVLGGGAVSYKQGTPVLCNASISSISGKTRKFQIRNSELHSKTSPSPAKTEYDLWKAAKRLQVSASVSGFLVHGLWFLVHGFWFMFYVLGLMFFGRGFRVREHPQLKARKHEPIRSLRKTTSTPSV